MSKESNVFKFNNNLGKNYQSQGRAKGSLGAMSRWGLRGASCASGEGCVHWGVHPSSGATACAGA